MSTTFKDFISLVTSYNKEEVSIVTQAYLYAKEKHVGQKRDNNEEYIVHPLCVAYTLAEMHADKSTLCAALLHDTIEDTNTSFEEIASIFGIEIAQLVDGVTKIRKMNFISKEDEQDANIRKILEAMQKDIRIIIIKLSDRLHNMRTLEYKSSESQKRNSMETLTIYAPLAYLIGAYRIKSELEDLSFKYLESKKYKEIEEILSSIKDQYLPALNEIEYNINKKMNENNLEDHTIKKRFKNIYGVYDKIKKNGRICNIHDLLSLKIMVKEKLDCYKTLGLIHELYHPINSKFKDYISLPKTNKYSSLHSTIYGPDGKLIQTQIRTYDMDKIASFGLTAYWDYNKGKAKEVMHDELNSNFQFFKTLKELYQLTDTNREFVELVKKEILSDSIYVYSIDGTAYSLPEGSTIIDFAYKIGTKEGDTLVGAIVNDEYVMVDYILKNKDRVTLLTNENAHGSKRSWEDIPTTAYARAMIKECK